MCIIRELNVKADDASYFLVIFFQSDGNDVIDQSSHDYPIRAIRPILIYIFLPLNGNRLSCVKGFRVAQNVNMENLELSRMSANQKKC